MIVGRVDVMRDGKVFGWAYNSESPDEHLEISINRGAKVIATGRANLMRDDLPDAGIGKGDHAFEIVLPPAISSLQGITLMAKSASVGEAALPIATDDDRRTDELFQILTQRYDGALVALKAEIDLLNGVGGLQHARDLTALPEFERRLSELEKRIEDFEVFVVRLDEISRILQERAGLTRRRGFFSFFLRK